MKLLKITNSTRKNKRYMAIFQDGDNEKKVHFGSKGENYTMHLDKKRKEAYLRRHAVDLMGDITSPGYLSYYITWNKPTIEASIKDYRRKFNL